MGLFFVHSQLCFRSFTTMSFRLKARFSRTLWKRVLQPSVLVITAIATLLAVSLFSISSLTAAPSAKIQFVPPAWVAANANDPNLRILDVRNFPLEYIAGHLPNAVNIADIAFRGPDGFLPVQYWETQKLGGNLFSIGCQYEQSCACLF
jgi:thiosulfate/3-mercaptopyruvate sulfurtransferase